MGFKKVYRALQEVFPEVDSRALRAVAIEHRKDADAAVEVVLTEVIPFLTERSRPSSSSSGRSMVKPPEVAVDAIAVTQANDGLLINLRGSDEKQNGAPTFVAYSGSPQSVAYVNTDTSAGSNQLLNQTSGYGVEVNGECENYQQSNFLGASNQASDLTAGTLNDPNKASSSMNSALHASTEVSHESFGHDCANEVNEDFNGENSSIFPCQVALPNVEDTLESSAELPVMPDMLHSDSQYLEQIHTSSSAAEKDTGCVVDNEDGSLLNTVVTRSGQICSVDLLEGIIADATSNKKTLFSAMESVISLMREVELQEKAAQLAKEAAANGGLDLLSRVEDLKQMLLHAKEANDMHSGEVYGERAILATEVRELQSRLLSLSEERDKSLAVLDEIHQALLSRMESAERERNEAEKEKFEKEESARKALAEQELVMDKVVREAIMLKEEAEANHKLREFLVDRGRVVDMLQGEISVICQDVKLLKENFDDNILFSKSLSSSQTSCILASSGSSFKSTAPDQVDQVPNSSENQKDSNLVPTSDNQPAEPNSSENQKDSDLVPTSNYQPADKDDRKALAEEGWEIFESGDYM